MTELACVPWLFVDVMIDESIPVLTEVRGHFWASILIKEGRVKP